MTKEESDKLLGEIRGILAPYPEAVRFIIDFGFYIDMIDDLVDGEEGGPEFILKIASQAAVVYSNNFYIKHIDILFFVDLLQNNDYADSVLWEGSNIEWQRVHADVIRHTGYHMLFCIILILAGRDKLRAISPRFREFAHERHLNDIIEYIRSAA